jgi:hypothetical protein
MQYQDIFMWLSLEQTYALLATLTSKHCGYSFAWDDDKHHSPPIAHPLANELWGDRLSPKKANTGQQGASSVSFIQK